MTTAAVLIAVYAVLSLFYWLWTAYGMFLVRKRVPRLSEVHAPDPRHWPRLSVVVAARNEAEKIEAAVRTLLDEDYPDLELVLVDDRSADETPCILDRLAREDPRVRTVHVTELPEDWLGKVNAMNRGFELSTGEFVLFTDADVHFRRGTLRKAMRLCVDRRLDHLTAMPEVWPATVMLDAAMAIFLRHLILITRPWKVGDHRSSAFLGIGAFNLVRRSAFERTPGFEWLRLEPGDDAALGLMMKRSGANCDVVMAFEDVALYWYRSLREAARGAERAYATVFRFSLLRTILMPLTMQLMECSPVLLLVPLASRRLRFLGLAGVPVFLSFVLAMLLVNRWHPGRFIAAIISPAAAPFLAAVLVRGGLVGRRQGGVTWRGTFYPAETLRRGRRLPIP
jgi:cellulose synthase/poly-beta-1,6-N-acetylglucosamine synthase-like glycosyltransferase